MKKIILFALVISLFAGMCLPAGAVYSSFPDVTDAELSRDVDALRMLGAVEGDGTGYFKPNDTLTRAQFCKMAVVVLGRGDEEYIYRNRTIFPDVRADHWARGYINLAVTAENKIIIGNGDGTFRPDDNISYAQAVTMLMRMLGYSDADAGMLWPHGYMELASSCGLTDGVNLAISDNVTRADAAELFCNLLNCEMKEGGLFASTLGTVHENAVVMSANGTTDDGRTGAIETSEDSYMPKNGDVPGSFVGLRGTLITDEKGYALTFIPDDVNSVSIIAQSAEAAWVKDNTGRTYDIPADTPAYTADKTGVYGDLWVDISTGCKVNIYYTEAGKVDGVFIDAGGSSSGDVSMVAYNSFSGNPFTALTGGDRNYQIYKNGVKAGVSDIRRYDCAVYDSGSRILYVSDNRITGVYEEAYPNTNYPSRVTLLGHEFEVLPDAVDALDNFNIGDNITLILTTDLKVAGAVAASTVRSNAIGVVTECTASSAKVDLFLGVTVSGEVSYSDEKARDMVGMLVTVASNGRGKIGLSRLTGGSSNGALDLDRDTVGGTELSASLKLFEKVGNSEMRQISRDDIISGHVPAANVEYVHTDYAGRADIIVLNDATGDMYTYGIFETDVRETGSGGGLVASNRVVRVTNGSASTPYLISGTRVEDGAFGGVVAARDGERVAGVIELKSIDNVKRGDFKSGDTVTVNTSEGVFVVSDDVVCYNAASKTWFSSLEQARAFSNDLTLYYDRDPEDGGQIRVVVAN